MSPFHRTTLTGKWFYENKTRDISKHERSKEVERILELQDHHKKLSPKTNLADVFSYHHKNCILQLECKQPCRITLCHRVTVVERIDGTIFMVYDKKKLNFTETMQEKKGHFYVGQKGETSISR